MKIIFAILLFVSAASAAGTVNLSNYATPNDGLCDSAGFQQAIQDLPNGGTIVVGEGTWNMNSTVNFVSSSTNSFVVKGQKGAVIIPDVGPSQALFISGNQNQMTFEDLIVVGQSSDTDLNKFVHTTYTNQLRIKGCQFFGLRAEESLIYAGNADVVIKDSLFHGISSGDAVIRAEDSRGLSVIDSEFLDYGNFNGEYYSKTPYGNPAWIKIRSTSRTANAMGQRGLVLENVRFDEGANYTVDACGISSLQANGVMVNVGVVAGFNLDNVKYAEIKMSQFGYTEAPRPAVRAMNGTTVYMDGVSLGAGVYYGVRDQTSQAFFNLKSCSGGCAFTVQDTTATPSSTGASQVGRH